jgi:catechol 2,3-dioxygenase-like lactoylglutathione lyase family enzyme
MSPPPAIDVRHVPGVRHIALSVDSVEAEYRRLSAAGVKFTVLPREGRVFPNVAKLAFCEGPDGVKVELMEERSQP